MESTVRGLILPLATGFLFAGSFIAGKYTTIDLDPMTTSLGRYVLALLFLTALLGHYKLSALKVDGRDLGWMSLLGLSGIAGYHYFFFLSLHYTEITNTAIINTTSPVLTGFAASIFLGERLDWRKYLGITLACIGVVILLARGDLQRVAEWRFNAGDVLMLLAVLCWVVYALLLKRLSDRYSSFLLTYYAVLSGVVILAILSAGQQPLARIAAMSTESWLSLVYMGFFASGLGYLLYTYCVANIGPTLTSGMVYSLVPLFVAVLAWIFFGESLTAVMAVSMIVVLAGLALMLKKDAS